MNNTKELRDIRARIGAKPDYFKGTKYEWNKLLVDILTPPNPDKTWVKTKNGQWQQE